MDRSEPLYRAVRSGTPTGRTVDLLDAADLFKRRPRLAYQIDPDNAHDHEAFVERFTNGGLGRRGYTR